MNFEHPELPGGNLRLEAKDERGMREVAEVRKRLRGGRDPGFGSGAFGCSNGKLLGRQAIVVVVEE
jgi:hypothetical protein